MKLFRGDRISFSERVAADMPDPRSYGPADQYRDFARLFDSPMGRRVLAIILVRCQLWERSYTPGDSHETAKREGMRDIGLWLMETINMEPAPQPAATQYEDPDAP